MNYLNAAFYRFAPLTDLPGLRAQLRASGTALDLRGTILLAPEGINAYLCGEPEATRKLVTQIRAIPGLEQLEYKESFSETQTFRRFKVKLKREIIPMRKESIQPSLKTGDRIRPTELKSWLDQGKEVILLDTRNEYEIDYGTFKGAKRMGMNVFHEFPQKLDETLAELSPQDREKPIVMFCTGGIRCEKATALGLELGLKNVYQLDGGILRYFEDCGRAHYEGDCFVFDQREAVTPELAPHPVGKTKI